jgi:hypothetical protein
METLWEKKTLSRDITERVKSYEDACEVLGIEEPTKAIRVYTNQQSKNLAKLTARHQQDIICEALNEGWEPDWNDTNQPKFYAWIKHAGSGFAFCGYVGVLADSSVGSRLYFKSRALAEYLCKQFIDLHNQAL